MNKTGPVLWTCRVPDTRRLWVSPPSAYQQPVKDFPKPDRSRRALTDFALHSVDHLFPEVRYVCRSECIPAGTIGPVHA